MRVKLVLQEKDIKEVVDRHLMVEAAISRIAEHVQQQDVFNESARTSISDLVDEVGKHVRISAKWERSCKHTNSTSPRIVLFRRIWRYSSTSSSKRT